MKRLGICVEVAAIFFGVTPAALAQTPTWVPLANTMFVLAPTESDNKIYLGANIDSRTKDVAINILDLSETTCKEGDTSAPRDTTPIKINGQFLKFIQVCINGTGINQPKTDAGKQFLNAAVSSGAPVVVETGTTVPLHYPGTNLAPVKAKLRAAAAAM